MDECKCLKCGHTWYKRVIERPKSCPNCKDRNWDEPRKKKASKKKEV